MLTEKMYGILTTDPYLKADRSVVVLVKRAEYIVCICTRIYNIQLGLIYAFFDYKFSSVIYMHLCGGFISYIFSLLKFL